MAVDLKILLDKAVSRLDPDEDDLACQDEYTIPSTDVRIAARCLAERIIQACIKPSNEKVLGAEHFVPRFGASANGGATLEWKNEQIHLLMSIEPGSPPTRGSFYGEATHAGIVEIKGQIKLDQSPAFIANWLVDSGWPDLSKINVVVVGPKNEKEAMIFAEESARVDIQHLIQKRLNYHGVTYSLLAERLGWEEKTVVELFEAHAELPVKTLAKVFRVLGEEIVISTRPLSQEGSLK